MKTLKELKKSLKRKQFHFKHRKIVYNTLLLIPAIGALAQLMSTLTAPIWWFAGYAAVAIGSTIDGTILKKSIKKLENEIADIEGPQMEEVSEEELASETVEEKQSVVINNYEIKQSKEKESDEELEM